MEVQLVQPIIAFDVNETLLDLSALDPLFERVFGDGSLRPLWFGQALQLSFVGIITNNYVDFTTAQHAALRMVAQRGATRLSDETAEKIAGGMRMLPAPRGAGRVAQAPRDRRPHVQPHQLTIGCSRGAVGVRRHPRLL
jgi:2-haloacid dehalogenase